MLQPVRLLNIMEPALVVVNGRRGAELAQLQVRLAHRMYVLNPEEDNLALLVGATLVARRSKHSVRLRVGVGARVNDVEGRGRGVGGPDERDQTLVLLVSHAEEPRERLRGSADDAVPARILPHHNRESPVAPKLERLFHLPVADARGHRHLARV